MDAIIGGRFRIDGLLGDGTMGVVYRGHVVDTGAPVAIKMLLRRNRHDEVSRQRFAREARLLADVMLPGVVRHVASNMDTPDPYLITELLPGDSLWEMLVARGTFTVPDAVFCACQLLTTLDAVHAAGILHRDIKPANVFATRCGDIFVAKLLDFGLGLTMDGQMTPLTVPGLRVGTPHYMSPALIESGEATPASDTYAVGVLLYELLTGELPCHPDANDPLTVMGAVMRNERCPIRALRPDVPTCLGAVIDHAVGRRTGFDTPHALLDALDATQGYAFMHSAVARHLTPAPANDATL